MPFEDIDGRKEDVFHIRLDDFMEIERHEGDFVDDRNEEAFLEREQANHRQEQAARLRKDRRDQAVARRESPLGYTTRAFMPSTMTRP